MEALGVDFFLKIGATAVVVLLATLVAERAGAFLGAIVVSLPLSAGPAYVVIAMEQDAGFVARSAETSLALNAVIGPMLLLTAAIMRRRGGLWPPLLAGLALWGAAAAATLQAHPPIAWSVPLNIVLLFGAAWLARPLRAGRARTAVRRGAGDILLRVGLVALAVGLAILAARMLGPRFAGVAAILPVVWISTAIVVHGRSGPEACAALMANGITTMNGFWIALLALALTAEPLGAPAALLLALAASAATGLCLAFGRPALKRLSASREPLARDVAP